MAKFSKKITNLLGSQVPEFVLEQHPKFVEFVRTYFTFMESAELTILNSQSTEGILLETETGQTNNLILNASRLGSEATQIDAGGKILQETSSFGAFTQNEIIKGSTSKIYAQKGTGNARHASRKAPIFVGGGVAHGPKGQLKYKKRRLNKNEKKLGIASIITEKNKNNNLIIFDDFEQKILKTKEIYKILIKFDATNSVIIADKKSMDNIYKSSKNIPNIKVTDINHFSAFDLTKYKKFCDTMATVPLA